MAVIDPTRFKAELLGLRRVDIQDADSLAVNLQLVAINHGRAAGDGLSPRRPGAGEQGGDQD